MSNYFPEAPENKEFKKEDFKK
nr:hypothetical protein [Chlamydiota bacterium]